MKNNAIRYLLGLSVLAVFLGHAIGAWRVPFISVVDAYLYDVRVRLSAPGTADERVVIVDIDEKSLAELGRWPWGRDKLAALVRQLVDHYQVAVVGFDVVFAEADESSGLAALERLGRSRLRDDAHFQSALSGLRRHLDYDRLFAEILRGRPVVLGYYFSAQSGARRTGHLPLPTFGRDSFAGHEQAWVRWAGYGANLEQFQNAAGSAGHFNPLVDFDGVSRRVPLLVEHDGNYYEALSLAVLRRYLDPAWLRPVFPAPGAAMEWLEVRNAERSWRIPVDENAAVLIPYRGPERSFPYLSAVDVLQGKVAADRLAGRIVLVGTSAPGLMDLRATPVGATYPGVEIHANLIAGMLDGQLREKPGFVLAAETLLLLAFGGLLIALLLRLPPLRAALLALGALLGAVAVNFSLWSAGVVLPLASIVLLILLLYALDAAWGYFFEARSKRQFAELFGQYVPPELVDEMARDPESYSMEGCNRELSVLFSDIRGFTSISEGLDPRELSQLMNAYLGAMTEVVRRQRGTLDKYIGDAIMAFWGAPVANPDHARAAVLTALDMQRELRRLDAPFQARGWPVLQIGIGINTGTMTVGDMGSPVRKAYTVMGDAVNLGSRLEGITKQYGVGIIISATTRAQCGDIVCRELDRVRVKGKDEPVAIYEPLGTPAEVSAAQGDELQLWQQALRLYRQQDWDGAELQLIRLRERAPEDKLYAVYLERIAACRQSPPPADWDGVTTFASK